MHKNILAYDPKTLLDVRIESRPCFVKDFGFLLQTPHQYPLEGDKKCNIIYTKVDAETYSGTFQPAEDVPQVILSLLL